ncbi:MAG: hypothetical protein K8L97_01550 [Anaerolineae bacterium]|nr:hypothetical protein [Anaerolineae bacterium]
MNRYPACELSDLYPILIHIPPEERQAYVEQAERAEPLRPEQLKALGLCTTFKQMVLLPKRMDRITAAQVDAVFPPGPERDAVIQELFRAAQESWSSR